MQWLQDLCYNEDLDSDDKTCEEVSNELYLKINEKYPSRTVWIDVAEDRGNGVLTQYDKRI